MEICLHSTKWNGFNWNCLFCMKILVVTYMEQVEMYNKNGFSSTNIRIQSSIMEIRTIYFYLMSIKNVKMDCFDDVFSLFFWKQIGINDNYFATPFISRLALRYIMKWIFTVIENIFNK